MKPVEMLPGERVLWTGKPKRFPVFEPLDLWAVPLSLAYLGYLIYEALQGHFWERPVSIFNGVLVTFYVVIGRLIHRQLALRGSTYVVTNLRVFATSKVFGYRNVRGSLLRYLAEPVVLEGKEGTGTIVFCPRERVNAWRWRIALRPVALRSVEDPEALRDLILAAHRDQVAVR